MPKSMLLGEALVSADGHSTRYFPPSPRPVRGSGEKWWRDQMISPVCISDNAMAQCWWMLGRFFDSKKKARGKKAARWFVLISNSSKKPLTSAASPIPHHLRQPSPYHHGMADSTSGVPLTPPNNSPRGFYKVIKSAPPRGWFIKCGRSSKYVTLQTQGLWVLTPGGGGGHSGNSPSFLGLFFPRPLNLISPSAALSSLRQAIDVERRSTDSGYVFFQTRRSLPLFRERDTKIY